MERVFFKGEVDTIDCDGYRLAGCNLRPLPLPVREIFPVRNRSISRLPAVAQARPNWRTTSPTVMLSEVLAIIENLIGSILEKICEQDELKSMQKLLTALKCLC